MLQCMNMTNLRLAVIVLLAASPLLLNCDPPDANKNSQPQAGETDALLAAKAVCAGPDASECLLREANRTSPPDMSICAAAAAASGCKGDPNAAPVCPAPALNEGGKCKIVFD